MCAIFFNSNQPSFWCHIVVIVLFCLDNTSILFPFLAESAKILVRLRIFFSPVAIFLFLNQLNNMNMFKKLQ